MARRLVICGMHVHVGIEDDELSIDLLGQAAYFLPHLLALSTSSPFWQGAQPASSPTGSSVFDELPRTGIPHQFASWSEYQRTVELLVNAGLIEDATKLWWDLRLSARFPTLEMRITDVCPLLDDGIAIAALYLLHPAHALSPAAAEPALAPLSALPRAREPLARAALRHRAGPGRFRQGRGRALRRSCSRSCSISSPRTPPISAAPPRWRMRAPSSTRGTSADRQLARYEAVKKLGGSEQAALVAVVDGIIEETMMPPALASAPLQPEPKAWWPCRRRH